MAYSGLRLGETRALRARNLDLLRGRVQVVEAYANVGTDDILGPTKSGERRVVTLPSFVIDQPRDHLERFPVSGPDDLVFKNRDGERIGRSAFARTFAAACRRVGLEGVTPHDLRHTAVALAIRVGAHLKEIQARAGHSSIQVTMDTYGHLFPGQDEALAARLDELRVGPMLAQGTSNVREMRSDQGKRI